MMKVMNWVESVNYVIFLKNASLKEHIEYAQSLLNIVELLHSLGIYHHDIKPSNFLYCPSTKSGVLIDYGTMLLVHLISNRTKTLFKKAKAQKNFFLMTKRNFLARLQRTRGQ